MKVLEEIGFFNSGHFGLTSGKHSNVYLNKDKLSLYPSLSRSIAFEIAERFSAYNIEAVCCPAVGSIVLGQWVAFHLNMSKKEQVFFTYADKKRDGFIIKRGFGEKLKDKRILIIEDIVTTGESVRKIIPEVKKYGKIIGLGILCNRGNVVFEDIPEVFSLLDLDFETWNKKDCPLCKDNVPINTEMGKGK